MTTSETRAGIGPVLITGGNGFLGRAVARALVERGEEVISVDLAKGQVPVEGVREEAADIAESETLLQIAEEHRISAIVHLAALVIPACKANPVKGTEVNIIGHLNMLEVARRHSVKRFVYTSSVAARPRAPFDSPVNLYGACKRCCEDISRIWFLDHGISSVGLRPNVVYGPGREQGETAAITLAIKAAARRESFQMPFAGSMGFQYLDEVVDIIIRCLRTTPEGPVVSDISERVETIDDVLKAIKSIEPAADILPSGNIRPAPPELDNSSLRKLLGDWPSIKLEEGIRRTFEYYRCSPI